VKQWTRVLRYFNGEAKAIAAGVLLMLLAVGASVMKPWPVAVIVDNIIGGKPMRGWISPVLSPMQSSGQIAVLAGLVLLLHLLQGFFSSAQNYLSIKVGLRGLARLRCELFRHMQRLSLAFYQRSNQGDLIYRATWDTYALQTMFQHGFFKLLNAASSLALMVAVMARLNGRLTLVTVATFPPMFLTMYFFGRAMNRKSVAAHQADSKVTSLVQQNIVALSLVQSYTQEPREQARFQERIQSAFLGRVAQHGLEVLYWFVIAALFGVATAGLSWFGADEILRGRLTVGELLIFLSYLGQLYDPLNQLTHVGATVSDASAGMQRIFEILDAPAQAMDSLQTAGKASPPTEPPRVQFENLSFGYLPGTRVLRGVSLTIEPGETVAIVGPSGAGKSTLLNLLPRFYDPAEGRLLLDGTDVREFALRALRERIGYVFQEPLLLPATIAENIAYGRPGAARDEVMAAARAANAHEFISKLQAGYDTVVGEGAAGLSVGEKQRINIARAFLKDAPLLLLDEPTSALDAETEAQVVQSLKTLFQNRTTLMVAHRLSTVEGVDKVLVIQNGQVTDFGTPEELLSKPGYFSQITKTSLGKI
jgi:ATP-binding cassette subfamily B protein